jgi:hypothetical protein
MSHEADVRRQAVLACVVAAATAVVSAGLMSAAALVPAPPAVIPLAVIASLACAMLAAVELAAGLRALRDTHWAARARRGLAQLPETPHPLGF